MLVLFEITADAMQMDVHKTPYPFYTAKKIPHESIGIEVVKVPVYDSTENPTSWRVNLVVAGAQVSLPTKQPDVLKLPSQSKAK